MPRVHWYCLIINFQAGAGDAVADATLRPIQLPVLVLLVVVAPPSKLWESNYDSFDDRYGEYKISKKRFASGKTAPPTGKHSLSLSLLMFSLATWTGTGYR